jgi:glycosyltransferase involved in cell wall biosynthesis
VVQLEGLRSADGEREVMEGEVHDRGGRTRLLMLGSLNHPHVEHLALAMQERGFDVTVGGNVLANLPGSVLPHAGIPTFAAPEQVRGSARGAAAHIRWIRRLLREVQPDVTHGHWLCGFACFAALAGAKPLVAMAWGSDVLRANRPKRVANRVALNRAELAMADSQALLDAMVELGGRRESMLLMSWGVDLEAFRPTERERRAMRADLGLPEGRIILSPRSLMPLYNPRTIVDAFELLADEMPDVQLVLKHMDTNRPPIGPLRYPERVHVVGHVPYERMVDWYQAADVCVSIASSDSSPRSVWEAVASGTPCVLSDLPWVHELIQPGRDALVVPIAPEPVAAALRSILDDSALAARLAESGRTLVESHHDRTVEMNRVAESYRRITP